MFSISLFFFIFWSFDRNDFSFSRTLKYLLKFCHFHISLYQAYVKFVLKLRSVFLFWQNAFLIPLSLICAFKNNLKKCSNEWIFHSWFPNLQFSYWSYLIFFNIADNGQIIISDKYRYVHMYFHICGQGREEVKACIFFI